VPARVREFVGWPLPPISRLGSLRKGCRLFWDCGTGQKDFISLMIIALDMDEVSRRRGKVVDGWLDLMLVQCSCAYFGWSYAKSQEPCR